MKITLTTEDKQNLEITPETTPKIYDAVREYLDEQKQDFWIPKPGEKYYFINSIGVVYWCYWGNDKIDSGSRLSRSTSALATAVWCWSMPAPMVAT